MTATDAARKVQEKRGYVVVGLPMWSDNHLIPGDTLTRFAGQPLQGCELRVTEPTNRKDWNAQVIAIFGSKAYDKNPARGNMYYRCELIPTQLTGPGNDPTAPDSTRPDSAKETP